MSAETDGGEFGWRDFNVGVDYWDVWRWRRMLPELEGGARHALFLEGEHRHRRSFQDPSPRFAARWWAKEVRLKARSPFVTVDMRRVEVRNGTQGRPDIFLMDPRLA